MLFCHTRLNIDYLQRDDRSESKGNSALNIKYASLQPGSLGLAKDATPLQSECTYDSAVQNPQMLHNKFHAPLKSVCGCRHM